MNYLNQYEFRPVHEDELKEFFRLQRYVFANNSEPTEEEQQEKDPLQPEMTMAAFHGGRLVATSGGFPFRMEFNGTVVDADGVTAVGTDPGHRRRGIVRYLITERLRAAYENNVPASILWASMGAIYQRFGYGLASFGYHFSFDPRAAAMQVHDDGSDGSVVRADRETALPIIKEIYGKFITGKNMMIHRAPEFWDAMYPSKKSNFHFAIRYNASGEPDGYAPYKLSQHPRPADGPHQRVEIHEWIYLNTDSYRSLWEYFRGHDLAKEVRMYAPADDPALFMLLEPRILHPRWEEGLWLRVVNVAQLAASRLYGNSGSVAFEVTEDADCPWNVGRYRVESDGIHSEVSAHSGDIDFQISINGLASLLSGAANLSRLCSTGRAEMVDPSRLSLLDVFFSTRYMPFCLDDF